MQQRLSCFETVAPLPDDDSTDSYCTPPEVMEPVHEAAGSIRLDPWTNNYAIEHGWVNAQESWTIESGRNPGDYIKKTETLDMSPDPRPWPLDPGDFVWGNPIYSAPHASVLRFMHEIDQAKAWGMLLLKTDNRTAWARWLLDRMDPIVIWRGVINFYHRGSRVNGNNFASTLYVVDGTGMDPETRKSHLLPIFKNVAWVR